MKLVPIGERVILKPEKKEKKTESGIYIPEDAREDKKIANVVRVGKDEDGNDLPLKEGDKVVYSGYSNEEIEIGDEKYVIVDFENIVAKYE